MHILYDPRHHVSKIPQHRTSQNDGLEELLRQLVLTEPPSSLSAIENRCPGAQSEVEMLVTLNDRQTPTLPRAVHCSVRSLGYRLRTSAVNPPKLH